MSAQPSWTGYWGRHGSADAPCSPPACERRALLRSVLDRLCYRCGHLIPDASVDGAWCRVAGRAVGFCRRTRNARNCAALFRSAQPCRHLYRHVESRSVRNPGDIAALDQGRERLATEVAVRPITLSSDDVRRGIILGDSQTQLAVRDWQILPGGCGWRLDIVPCKRCRRVRNEIHARCAHLNLLDVGRLPNVARRAGATACAGQARYTGCQGECTNC